MQSKENWQSKFFPDVAHSQNELYLSENKTKPIMIYGAGYAGLMFAEILVSQGIVPECILDTSPQKYGRVIRGIKVRKPSEMLDNDALIIVCILKKGNTYREIKKNLEQMGYHKVIHLFDLTNDHRLFKEQKLIISPDLKKMWKNKEKIYQTYLLMEDEQSRIVYNSIIRYLWGDKKETITAHPLQEQYFAYDLFSKNKNEVFIDCGAHTGETLHQFLEYNKNEFKSYWAIEPDESYIRYIRKESGGNSKIRICNFALGSQECDVHLRNYDGSNSVICENGEIKSRCFPLDSFLNDLKVTHLKIDAEGWDYAVLLGAEKTILKYQPIISVAIYHKECDLWRIPLLLHKWVPGYRFYVRSYMNVYETILYAVPSARSINNVNI